MQHDSSQGTRQRSGEDDQNNQGKDTRPPGDAPILTYAEANEDQVCVLHRAVA